MAPAPKFSRGRGMARMAVDEMLGADVETGGVFDPLVRWRCLVWEVLW